MHGKVLTYALLIDLPPLRYRLGSTGNTGFTYKEPLAGNSRTHTPRRKRGRYTPTMIVGVTPSQFFLNMVAAIRNPQETVA